MIPRGIVVRARGTAPAAVTWELLADPRHWPAWAPHITAVTSPHAGPVAVGQRLRVHGPVGLRVPADVTFVDPGRRWDFRVPLPGPWRVVSRHDVRVCAIGSEVRVAMHVDGPVGRGALPGLLAYQPLARIAIERLARLAADRAAGTTDAAR